MIEEDGERRKKVSTMENEYYRGQGELKEC